MRMCLDGRLAHAAPTEATGVFLFGRELAMLPEQTNWPWRVLQVLTLASNPPTTTMRRSFLKAPHGGCRLCRLTVGDRGDQRLEEFRPETSLSLLKEIASCVQLTV